MANSVPYITDQTTGQFRKLTGTDTLVATDLSVRGPLTSGYRLSLLTADPVPAADQSNKTSIFLTPWTSNRISLYRGGVWSEYSPGEMTFNLGTLTANLPYDLFLQDSAISGTPAFEAVAWTSDAARTTAIARQDGRWTKSGDATRLYLGSFRTTSTTQTQDTKRQRLLFNSDNRIARSLLVEDETAHVYTTAVTRQYGAVATNQVEFLRGLNEGAIVLGMHVNVTNTLAAVTEQAGMGLDSTVNFDAMSAGLVLTHAAVTVDVGAAYTVAYDSALSIGYHYVSMNEAGQGSGVATWNRALLSGVCTC